MKLKEPIDEVRSLVDSVRIGMLATIGSDGYPHARWMTATTLQGEKDFIYCVSVAGTKKVEDILGNDRVQWSFQGVTLDRVMTVTGRAAVIEAPELKAQVIESLGCNLDMFWRINPDPKKLVVIETAIERLSVYRPAAGEVNDLEILR